MFLTQFEPVLHISPAFCLSQQHMKKQLSQTTIKIKGLYEPQEHQKQKQSIGCMSRALTHKEIDAFT